jgi:hypothetical protein
MSSRRKQPNPKSVKAPLENVSQSMQNIEKIKQDKEILMEQLRFMTSLLLNQASNLQIPPGLSQQISEHLKPIDRSPSLSIASESTSDENNDENYDENKNETMETNLDDDDDDEHTKTHKEDGEGGVDEALNYEEEETMDDNESLIDVVNDENEPSVNNLLITQTPNNVNLMNQILFSNLMLLENSKRSQPNSNFTLPTNHEVNNVKRTNTPNNNKNNSESSLMKKKSTNFNHNNQNNGDDEQNSSSFIFNGKRYYRKFWIFFCVNIKRANQL